MKKLVLIISIAVANLFITSKLRGQNSIYLISEVYSIVAPFFDSVYVTSPTGLVAAYKIPNISNVAGHDAALNVILNGVSTLGYTISDYNFGRTYNTGSQTIFYNSWFLKKP